MGRAAWWSAAERGVAVTLRVTPGGPRSEVLEASPSRLRLRVAAPAVEGRANTELRRFVAELFGVRLSAVTVVRGARARDKTVLVAGVSAPPPALVGAGSPEGARGGAPGRTGADPYTARS